MSQTEYEAAVARFLSKKPITRCPTACVTPTRGSVAEADRADLRKYSAAQEGAPRKTAELRAPPTLGRSLGLAAAARWDPHRPVSASRAPDRENVSGGSAVLHNTGISANLADKAKKLGIPVWHHSAEGAA